MGLRIPLRGPSPVDEIGQIPLRQQAHGIAVVIRVPEPHLPWAFRRIGELRVFLLGIRILCPQFLAIRLLPHRLQGCHLRNGRLCEMIR